MAGKLIVSFRVMTFDSGGVRSLVSALLINDIDAEGKLVRNTELFVGTSSGAIVALALAYGIRAAAIADFFAKNAATIYEKADADWNEGNPFTFEQQVALDTVPTYDKAANGDNIKSVFQAKYRSQNLRDALIGLFGNARLSELPRSGPQVAVTALQLSDQGQGGQGQWKPVLIGSGRKDPLSEMLLADAAMASMATPTLFAPYKPSLPMGERWGYFVDGGLFASNPAMAGIEYASEHCGTKPADIQMVSFGTGKSPTGIASDELGRAACWGAWQWMKPYASEGKSIPAVPLINATRSASAQMSERYAAMILGSRFLRVDFNLEESVSDCDGGAVALLQQMTKRYLQSAEQGAINTAVRAAWMKVDDSAAMVAPSASKRSKSRLSQMLRL